MHGRQSGRIQLELHVKELDNMSTNNLRGITSSIMHICGMNSVTLDPLSSAEQHSRDSELGNAVTNLEPRLHSVWPCQNCLRDCIVTGWQS